MSREEAIEILSDMRAEYNLFGDEEEAIRYHVLSWAIQAMSSAQQWIPVTESLPEDNEYVLVTTAEGGVTDAKYWHRERIWVKGLAIVNVTAWMSLPNPWRGEEG